MNIVLFWEGGQCYQACLVFLAFRGLADCVRKPYGFPGWHDTKEMI